jgi:hypothetical protein
MILRPIPINQDHRACYPDEESESHPESDFNHRSPGTRGEWRSRIKLEPMEEDTQRRANTNNGDTR